MSDDERLRALLDRPGTVAVVGLSPDPTRASHDVAAVARLYGWRVIGVNPRAAGQTILGETVCATLADIEAPIDLVDVFRRAEELPGVAHEAVAAGAKALWMQLGLRSAEAARIAEEAGVPYVEDRCLKIELLRLYGPPSAASQSR